MTLTSFSNTNYILLSSSTIINNLTPNMDSTTPSPPNISNTWFCFTPFLMSNKNFQWHVKIDQIHIPIPSLTQFYTQLGLPLPPPLCGNACPPYDLQTPNLNTHQHFTPNQHPTPPIESELRRGTLRTSQSSGALNTSCNNQSPSTSAIPTATNGRPQYTSMPTNSAQNISPPSKSPRSPPTGGSGNQPYPIQYSFCRLQAK